MTRPTFIPIILAMFFGLASQFQVTRATAQQVGGINNIFYTFVTAPGGLQPGQSMCSPANNNCVTMQTDGNLVLFNGAGNPIWASALSQLNCGSGPGTCSDFGAWFMYFTPLGTIQVYDYNSGVEVYSDLSEENGGGVIPYYLAIQDDGNLVVYDAGLNVIWSVYYDGLSTSQGENFYPDAAQYAQNQCIAQQQANGSC